jgi:hypothetical protein
MRQKFRRFIAFLAIAVSVTAVSSCSAAGSPNPTTTASMPLHVSNGTTLDVTLRVNGHPVGLFKAGGLPLPSIDQAALPPLPWTVEATSPSGRILTTMTVTAEDAAQSDADVHRIPMGRVDLSCGRLTIYAGDFAPSGPVPQSPAGSVGDCEP